MDELIYKLSDYGKKVFSNESDFHNFTGTIEQWKKRTKNFINEPSNLIELL